jgi:hypothetical protein
LVEDDAVPVPDSATVSGLPAAEDATVREPVADPVAVGVKARETVQDPSAAIEAPQVLVWLNGPETASCDTETALLFGFDTVTFCALLVDPTVSLPNDRLDGDAVSALPGLLLAPVPDRPTVSGLDGALLATDRLPVADPAAVGAKDTLTVHDPLAAMELPQVLVWLNGPLTLTEETDTALLFGFDTVTVCALLVDPTVVLPNDRLDGDAVSALLGPVPPPPEPGKISSSDSWAALQPVLAVKLSSTYWALVPDGRLIVTVLPVDGLNVYPADATIWLNEEPLVLPSTDSVSVRVAQALDGGKSRVSDPIDCTDPRFTVSVCGYAAPSLLSQ